MSAIRFEPIAANADVLRLALDEAALPTDDLGEDGLAFFGLFDDQRPIGFVGLQGAGVDRLLRSLVVLTARKRQGAGGLLVANVEAFARSEGVERLHLLTTTAANFFLARGYHSAERDSAPSAIGATAQFSSLCPNSAAYLCKDIS